LEEVSLGKLTTYLPISSALLLFMIYLSVTGGLEVIFGPHPGCDLMMEMSPEFTVLRKPCCVKGKQACWIRW
jgi:hypothetical protein